MASATPRSSPLSAVRFFVLGVFSRIIRRGFFRLVLLFFLLFFLAPMVAVNVLANRSTGNWLLEQAVGEVFNTELATVAWDQPLTEVTGPGLSLMGTVTYRNIVVKRRLPLSPPGTRFDYALVELPELVLRYDFKRLPGLPITRVEVPKPASLYFNTQGGRWLDADLFKPGGGEDSGFPRLPQFILRNAQVRVRADSVLRPPEDLPADVAGGPRDWYDFFVNDLSLLPSRANPDAFDLSGRASGIPFGSFDLAGSVARDGSRVEVLFAQRGMKLDGNLVSALSIEVRRIYDQFQIEGVADIACRLVIPEKKPLDFQADIDIYDGRLCFVGFPLQVTPATARLHVHNNRVVIEAIRGRRDSASVLVTGEVSNIGSIGENLQVSVDIRDLLVDERFRLGLLEARLQPGNENPETGRPWPAEAWTPALIPPRARWESDAEWRRRQGYPEWPGQDMTAGGVVYPNLDAVLPFVARGFVPTGYCNFRLDTRETWKGGYESIKLPDGRTTQKRITDRDQKWWVYVRDASACYVGLPEQNEGGFPIPIYRGFGVVEGTVKSGTPSVFLVRGYNADELARIPEAEERGMRPSSFLSAERSKPGQRVNLRATYRDPEMGPPDLVLNINSEGIDVDETFKDALPKNIRDIVETFQPRGRADVESAEVKIIPALDKIDYQFTIKAKGVMARYQFEGASRPVELSDIQGNLRINNITGVVEVSSVRGRLAGSQVYLDVTYRVGERDPAISFSAGAEDFAIVPVIADMLPPQLSQVFTDFEPAGNILLRVAGTRDVPGEANRIGTEVSFRGGSARYVKFPYLLTSMTGRVFVEITDGQVVVSLQELGGTGSSKDSSIRVGGHVQVPLAQEGAEAGKVRYDLHVRASRINIDDALIDALVELFREKGQTEKPAVVRFIEDLNITGTIGIDARLAATEQGENVWGVEISLEGCAMNYTKFPYPVSDLTGTVIIDGTDLEFQGVQGRAEGQGKVMLTEASYAAEQGWRVALSARTVPFTATLRNALPQALMARFDAAKPDGVFDIDIALQGKDEAFSFQCAMDLHDTSLDLGLHFDKVNARVDFSGLLQGDKRRANGSLRVDSLLWKDARFNDLTTSVQFVNDRLVLPNLRGLFYGGSVEGSLSVTEAGYEGQVQVRGADLGELGRTAFPKAGQLQGAIDGELVFYSQPDRNGQIGRGRVDVAAFDATSSDPKRREAKLAEVPLFSQIFATTKNPQNFDEGHVFFWLGPDRLTIREMDFVSDAARVEVFGGDDENYIIYDTAEMRMKLFFTIAPRAPTIPGIQQIFDLLKQILFPLYVTGTLNSPKVEPFSLEQKDLDSQRDQFPRPPREN